MDYVNLLVEEMTNLMLVLDLFKVSAVIGHDVSGDTLDLAKLGIHKFLGLHVLVGESTDVLSLVLLSLDTPKTLEERHEVRVFAALSNSGDLSALWLLPLLLVLEGDLHAGVLLNGGGISALPNVDLLVQFKDEGIVREEHLALEWAILDLINSDFALLLADVPEAVLGVSVLVDLLSLFFVALGWLHVSSAATKLGPELLLHVAVAGEMDLGSHLAHVVLEIIAIVDGGLKLELVGRLSLPDVDISALIKDEHITLVQVLGGNLNWEDPWVSLADHAHELVNMCLGHVVLEATVNAAVQVLDATLGLEHGHEEVALLTHQLQVVRGLHVEVVHEAVGQLRGERGSAPRLIGSGVFALPVVDVVLLPLLENAHIAVSVVELTEVLADVDHRWSKVLDSVDLDILGTTRVQEGL